MYTCSILTIMFMFQLGNFESRLQRGLAERLGRPKSSAARLLWATRLCSKITYQNIIKLDKIRIVISSYQDWEHASSIPSFSVLDLMWLDLTWLDSRRGGGCSDSKCFLKACPGLLGRQCARALASAVWARVLARGSMLEAWAARAYGLWVAFSVDLEGIWRFYMLRQRHPLQSNPLVSSDADYKS